MAASLQGTLLTDFLPQSEVASIEAGSSDFDCTWSLTAAAAKGKPVILPAGVITASAFSASVPIIGCGKGATTLRAGAITISAANVRLECLTVESSAETAVVAANVNNFALRDAAVSGAAVSVDGFNSACLEVSECSLSGGVQLSGCEAFLIQSNRWECGYANTAEPIHASANSHGIIVGNTIRETATDAIDLYSSGARCIVTGNRIDGCRGASAIEAKVTMSDNPANSSGGLLGYVESSVIANNIITNLSPPSNGTRAAIYAEYVDSRAEPSFFTASTSRGMVISGNVIDRVNVENTEILGTYWGIAFTGHNTLIEGNVIRGIHSHNTGLTPCGIRLSQPAGSKCAGVVVQGNVIAGVEGWSGIETGALDRCVFANNVIRQDEATGLAPKFGINMTGLVQDCSFSGNAFELNVPNSFGLRMASGQFDRCTVAGNVFRDCGVTLAAADFLAFAGNQMHNAANSQGLTIGAGRGAKITANHFGMSGDYAVVLTDHSGFVVSGNTFNDTNRPLVIAGASANGIVRDNISYSQMQAAPIYSFSGVSVENQATVSDGGNAVLP